MRTCHARLAWLCRKVTLSARNIKPDRYIREQVGGKKMIMDRFFLSRCTGVAEPVWPTLYILHSTFALGSSVQMWKPAKHRKGNPSHCKLSSKRSTIVRCHVAPLHCIFTSKLGHFLLHLSSFSPYHLLSAHFTCCMSKKSCPNGIIYSLCQNGQDSLSIHGIQWVAKGTRSQFQFSYNKH